MAITDRFVLPAGTIVRPAFELPETIRSQIAAGESDFVLSRPGSRAMARVIDSDAALLIAEFEKPSTIARAVARFSRGRPDPPEDLLESAWPLLKSLIDAELLVDPESAAADDIRASLPAGAEFANWTIVRSIQSQQDTELYQARDKSNRRIALKIARGDQPFAGAALAHESRLLSALDGKINPQLLEEGEREGRRYLAMDWVEGIDAVSAAAEFRSRGDADSLRELVQLSGAILHAYAHLHSQQTVHGDVHPRNVLVDRRGAVRIVDFGLGRRLDDPAWENFALRGGVSFFLDPELARSMLENAQSPPATVAGEQYALAAVLYEIITGSYYADFNLERQQMLRQIIESPMLPFAARGLQPWPEVEEPLARALRKDPLERFPSVAEFARQWQLIRLPDRSEPAAPYKSDALRHVRAELLRQVGLSGPLLHPGSLPAPATSLNFGSAGVAHALYRMACAADNGELFALADLWCVRALSEVGREDAFYSAEMEITEKTMGKNSLWHGAAGVHLLQGLIARDHGDLNAEHSAAEAFLRAAAEPSPLLELALGNAGALHGCALFLDLLRDDQAYPALRDQAAVIRHLGSHLLAEIWRILQSYRPISDCPELSNLGIAHGWAGILYATLTWCAASGDAPPTSLPDRLHQLAALAEPSGRGLRWPWDLAKAHFSMSGWCNGSAGYVFLWTAAHAAFAGAGWLSLAEGAAWDVWDTPSSVPTLCCGTAGQAYALLNLHRHTGESLWLRRAQDLALRCADAPWDSDPATPKEFRPLSLYKGNPGIAVLAADLELPQQARMPIFERESL